MNPIQPSTAAGRSSRPCGNALLGWVDAWLGPLAAELAARDEGLSQRELNRIARQTIVRIAFLRLCEDRGVEPHGTLRAAAQQANVSHRWETLLRRAGTRYGGGLFRLASAQSEPQPSIDDRLLASILTGLYDPDRPGQRHLFPDDALGQVYESLAGREVRIGKGRRVEVAPKAARRKAAGVYYTPAGIVDYVARHTLGRQLAGRSPQEAAGLRIVDPACGSGSFLLGAFECLLDGLRRRSGELPLAAKREILARCLYGVDVDPQAVEVSRLSLLLKLLEDASEAEHRELGDDLAETAANVRCGNALIGPDFPGQHATGDEDGEVEASLAFDWPAAFPEAFCGETPGFDVVLGNPPWGQKAVGGGDRVKRYLWERFPSSGGIFDLFRPFVEQGVRLTAPGGRFGMVLPDIVLLKNYAPTRRLLLESLALERIDWWGNAFPDAVIDTTTIIGRRGSAPPDHRVAVCLHDGAGTVAHEIPQNDFWHNPRLTFNLHLTGRRREVVRALDARPKLGRFFEVHEGVHSGNIRRELFVDAAVDATCRPLYVGRGEIAPYRLRWAGRYVRCGAAPRRRTTERYANLGRPQWHERDKLLVRRTGDFVLAAVDRQRRYASNNFFLVIARGGHPLELDGLCAVLNSRAMTWYFRTVEPRMGRVFAELKIKHLAAFPLPDVDRQEECRRLNRLGRRRAELAEQADGGEEACRECDAEIEQLVGRLLGLPPEVP